jgi:hypothetical protein
MAVFGTRPRLVTPRVPTVERRAARGEDVPAPVLPSTVVVWLSVLIGALAVVAAGVGLVWQGGPGAFTFTSLHGEAVEIYWRGLYRYETVFKGALNRGTDFITLSLGLPLLIGAVQRYRHGSLRGSLLLLGTLPWFLYAYASAALGIAYNNLFLVYVTLFSASLYAFVLCLTSIDRAALRTHFGSHLPRHGLAVFLFASGLVTMVVWLVPLLAALARNEPPAGLDSNTTSVTDVLDLGLLTPAMVVAGALVLRRRPLGYLIAFSLLVLEAMLAPMIAAQTVSQLEAGVTFTTGEIVGPIGGFVTVSLMAVGMLVALFRNISESARPVPADG